MSCGSMCKNMTIWILNYPSVDPVDPADPVTNSYTGGVWFLIYYRNNPFKNRFYTIEDIFFGIYNNKSNHNKEYMTNILLLLCNYFALNVLYMVIYCYNEIGH